MSSSERVHSLLQYIGIWVGFNHLNCNPLIIQFLKIKVVTMPNIYSILTLLIALLQTSRNHVIHQLSHLSSNESLLHSAQFPILIQLESSGNYPQGQISRNYYLVRTLHKQKKEAYNRLKDMLKHITSILVHNKALPHQSAFVHSKIAVTYLSKKRSWSISTVFIVMGEEDQLQGWNGKLRGLRLQKLEKVSSVTFSPLKMESLIIFNKAKQALLRQLKKFPYLQIESVFQFQQSNGNTKSSNSSPSLSDEQSLMTLPQQRKAKQMKIVFKIGPKIIESQQQQQSDQQSDEDYSDESYNSNQSL